MDHIQSIPYNSAIDKVLQTYQTVALSTLQGPNNSQPRWGCYDRLKIIEEDPTNMKGKEVVLMDPPLKTVPVLSPSMTGNEQIEKYVEIMDPILNGSPFPIQQMPVLTPIDNTRSEKCETILENEQIACFIVGGEKRLCLPQILNSVLRDYSLRQINLVCDELYIYCSRCSPEQLEILKVTGILPFSAPSCGLITKTDAERLCNALLYTTEKQFYYGLEKKRKCHLENTFGVYHECFGKCKGVYFPELYNHPDAPCIECAECMNVFSPQKFIVHSHGAKENRTCHWGFDSANWRSYLMLANSVSSEEKYQDLIDEMKGRFDYRSRYKRKQGTTDENGNKRQRVQQGKDINEREAVVTSAWSEGHPQGHVERPSAFRPWSPSDVKSILPEQGTVLVHDGRGAPTLLSTGPPVLLNPERVVPANNASSSSAAPNVALAPLSVQLGHHYSPKNSSPPKDGPDSTKLSPCHDEQKCNRVDINLEFEIEAVRSVLMKGQLDTRESRENLLRDLSMIHQKQEERLRKACQELETVKQSKKEKLRDSAEIKRKLRNDIDKMSVDHARKVSEMVDGEKRHKKEIELLKSKHVESQDDLRLENVRLRAENECLLEKLEALEKEIKDLKTIMPNHPNTESVRSTSPEGGSPPKKQATKNITIKTEVS